MQELIGEKIKNFIPEIGLDKHKSIVRVTHKSNMVYITIEGPLHD